MENTKLEQQYSMLDWYKKVLTENYANFSGRARRAEYWNFFLMNIIIIITLYIFVIIGAASESPILAMLGVGLLFLYSVATLLPSLAVAVRRLHDTNKSGAFLLLGFVPLVGIILLVFYATEGDRNTNEYGPDPKNYMEVA